MPRSASYVASLPPIVRVRDGNHIVSFFHSGDLFGLSEEGRYSNATKAATPVVAYKIPLSALRRILDNNPNLDVNVIVKLCEELREAQRHALLLVQRRATTRLSMFLDLQQHLQAVRGVPAPRNLPADGQVEHCSLPRNDPRSRQPGISIADIEESHRSS